MELIFFIGVIVLLFLVVNLRGRVSRLEQLSETRSAVQSPAQSQAYREQVSQVQVSAPIELSSQSTPQEMQQFNVMSSTTEPDALGRLGDWLKEDWLLKLGAFLLLIGFGWLTTYAFLNNWIGPMGRIVLGIMAGVVILSFGWFRIKSYLHQGGIFLVLGSTTILLTIFAARGMYDFFTPLAALIVMFLSTAFVALASVKYKSRSLALCSLILAGIAPLLTNSPTTDYIGLFAYLLAVILGAIWITVLTGHRELTLASLCVIALYSLPHLMMMTQSDKGVLLLFAYAFAGIFFITNTIGILKSKETAKGISVDLVTAFGNGILLLMWIMVAAPDVWRSLIISAWMIVFAVGAFLTFKATNKREPFYVYAGVGIAMLAAATSAELQGATLTIAYAIESGLVAFITYLLLKDILVAEKMTLLLIGPVLLSLGSMSSYTWATSVFHKDFFVLFILGSVLFGLGLFFMQKWNALNNSPVSLITSLLLIGGSAYAYILIWLSLHAAFTNDDIAAMMSLVIYTIIGLITYFAAAGTDNKALRMYGGSVLGLVVVRLLLVDIWNMEIAGKIVTFFLVGTLLMTTAFLGRKKTNTSGVV